MACHDHDHAPTYTGDDPTYRRALWAVITINCVMFIVELGAGITAKSMALQADALDFLADSLTYGLSLFVLAKPPMWRANAALFKGVSLAVLGVWVLGSTIWRVFVTGVPEAFIMGSVGLLALAANVASVLILMRFRSGDANVESVWLCSRNDAIGNVAVVLAASGVFVTGSAWPDLALAAIMASLFLSSSFKIIKNAAAERSQHPHI
ncbi:MAG: cation transporter [Alphaproteobacteria bacterium]